MMNAHKPLVKLDIPLAVIVGEGKKLGRSALKYV